MLSFVASLMHDCTITHCLFEYSAHPHGGYGSCARHNAFTYTLQRRRAHGHHRRRHTETSAGVSNDANITVTHDTPAHRAIKAPREHARLRASTCECARERRKRAYTRRHTRLANRQLRDSLIFGLDFRALRCRAQGARERQSEKNVKVFNTRRERRRRSGFAIFQSSHAL